jgi:hypothetical protein
METQTVSVIVRAQIKGWLAGSLRVISGKKTSLPPKTEKIEPNIISIPPTQPERRANKSLPPGGPGVSSSVKFYIKEWLEGSRRVISEKNTKTPCIPNTGKENVYLLL